MTNVKTDVLVAQRDRAIDQACQLEIALSEASLAANGAFQAIAKLIETGVIPTDAVEALEHDIYGFAGWRKARETRGAHQEAP